MDNSYLAFSKLVDASKVSGKKGSQGERTSQGERKGLMILFQDSGVQSSCKSVQGVVTRAAVFQRLAHDFEDVASELGKFI